MVNRPVCELLFNSVKLGVVRAGAPAVGLVDALVDANEFVGDRVEPGMRAPRGGEAGSLGAPNGSGSFSGNTFGAHSCRRRTLLGRGRRGRWRRWRSGGVRCVIRGSAAACVGT